ncbi:biotin/lipoyl-binding protein [uncultured Abyssibacter sp.]|uniref:HlyD family secretion protein n=1 Tax=uncultured Abyssibacter sp. TaxID=2320202 RepID=UPI0032B1B045
MRASWLLPLALGCGLAGCDNGEAPMVGLLDWDRVDVVAERSEPVTALRVEVGDTVSAGDLLLQLDAQRADAELRQAEAQLARTEARLAELRHGARAEEIEAARADVEQAESSVRDAEQEHARIAELRERLAVAQAELDRAGNRLEQARASLQARRAGLSELLNGTRPEQLEQAMAERDGAAAALQLARTNRERVDAVAPVSGRVDAIPHRVGDRARSGEPLVTLLSGAAPFCRIYVPEPERLRVTPGTSLEVMIDGRSSPVRATVRSVRSEPAFTPYFALQGEDASRLSYAAELVLQGDGLQNLPAGLPCRATLTP